MPSADAFATIGGTDNPAQGMGDWAEAYLGQIAQYSGGAKNLTLDGVKIPHLYPGTKLIRLLVLLSSIKQEFLSGYAVFGPSPEVLQKPV